MGVAFPLSPVPSWYGRCDWQNAGSKRNGVHYVGDTVTITLTKSGATAYSVRDYWGNVVSSGSVSGTSVTPTPPSGGWKPGWYRIYFTGPNNDSLFGTSYSATNFCVIRSNSNFIPMPAGNTASGDATTDGNDFVMKGVMGIGTSRLIDADVTNPAIGNDSLNQANTEAAGAASTYWTNPGAQYLDPARTRYLWATFPSGTVDYVSVPGGSGGTFLRCYVKDTTVSGSTTFVSSGAGSSSGYKITVYSPNSSTVVETYDNLPDPATAATKINAASSYIKAFNGGTGSAGTLSATAIGTTYHDGVANAVSTLYANGVTRFEGPSNEPSLSAEIAQQMMLYQKAVHDGNASAKAIGPCPVDINSLTNWTNFLAAGGGSYCDEISFHDYNSITNGDMNLGRYSIENFQALLTKYGLQSKTLWQTEANGIFSSVYGVYHPRRSRVPILTTLLWEQYGIPRERNNFWYDISHGFWSFPSWLENGDASLNPICVIYRVLAEETWGMTHSSKLDFGSIGDHIFLGSIYTAASGASTAVFITTSYMDNSSVTLTVAGTSSALTVVDGFGNTSTVTPTNGRITISVSDIPTYLELPNGVSVAVYSCNDWPPVNVNGQGANSGPLASGLVGSLSTSVINDGGFMTDYANSKGIFYSANTVPDTATLTWSTASRVDRVVVWCGPAWQSSSALVDFDVQTTTDGTTWTTQATVTKTTPSSFLHGTDANGVGCQRETYWDEQWIFDVKLPSPVTAKGVRLNVRATSYGGEPDAACVTAGGQGDSNQHLVLQEIAVLCDDNTNARYAIR